MYVFQNTPPSKKSVEIFTIVPNFPQPSYAPAPIAVEVANTGDIIFSVPTVSQVIAQYSEWEGHKIHYRIGHIDYAWPDGRELNDLACHRIPPPSPDVKMDDEDFPKFGLECTSPSP
jgi:hypothetical protein